MANAAIITRTRARNASQEEEGDIGITAQYAGRMVDVKEQVYKYSSFWAGIEKSIRMQRATHKLVSSDLKHHEVKKLPDEDTTVFNPNNPSKMKWDIFICMLVVYSIIVIPYRIGFDQRPNVAAAAFDYIIDALFFIDILVSFNTSYLDLRTEEYVVDRSKIAANYCKFWFWVDLSSTLPIDNMLAPLTDSSALSSFRAIRILRLVRLLKLFKLEHFTEYLERHNVSPGTINLMTLLLQIIFVAHLFACFWHFVAIQYYHNNKLPNYADYEDAINGTSSSLRMTWLYKFGYLESDLQSRYIASLYYILVTMLTVGYGDIFATNRLERFFAILTMLTGCIVFGALISKVTALIDKRNPQAKAYKEKMTELKALLEDRGISSQVKKQAKEAYMYFLNKKSSFGENSIYADLPERIRNKLVLQSYANEIKKVALFQKYPNNFVVQLIMHCRPFRATKGEVICGEGDTANEMIFITSGHVKLSVLAGNDETLVGYAMEHDYFGDFEFYKNTVAIATYSAVSNCSFLAVNHAVVNKACSENPDAGRRFQKEIKRRYTEFMKAVHLPGTVSDRRGADELNGSDSGVKLESPDNDAPFASRKMMTKSSLWMSGRLEKYTTVVTHFVLADLDSSKASGAHMLQVVTRDKSDGTLVLTNMTGVQLNRMLLIHPKQLYKIYWDIFIGFWIVFSLTVIPVQIAFAVKPDADSTALDLFIDSLFFVDIMASFRTAYESDGAESAYVILPEYIAKNYATSWFILDILSTLPLDLILGGFIQGDTSALKTARLLRIVRLVRLLKLARVLKLNRYIDAFEDNSGIPPVFFDFTKLLIEVYFIGHFVACAWWGFTQVATETTWSNDVQGQNFNVMSLMDRYMVSLYWTFTTMTTVGYGDITSINVAEQLINIPFILIMVSVFGYVVANVATILHSLNPSDAKKTERLTEITEYLNEKNCGRSLREDVTNHFRHLFTLTSAFDEESILNRLPKSLSNRILLQQYEHRMKHIAVLNFVDNESVRLYLFQLLKPVFFEQDQYVVREGREANEVFFLVFGKAKAFCKIHRGAKSPTARQRRKRQNKKRKSNSSSRQSPVGKESPRESRGRRGSRDSNSVQFSRENSQVEIHTDNDTVGSATGPPSATSESSTTRTRRTIGRSETPEFLMQPLASAEVGSTEPPQDRSISRTNSENERIEIPRQSSKTSLQTHTPTPPASPRHIPAGQASLLLTPKRQSSFMTASANPWQKKPQTAGDLSSMLARKQNRRDSSSFGIRDMLPVFVRSRLPHSGTSQQNILVTEDSDDDEDYVSFGASTGARKDVDAVPFHKWNQLCYEKKQLRSIGSLHPGSFFGHIGLMDKTGTHTASVRAVERCMVYSLSETDLNRLIKIEPTVAIILQSALVEAINSQSNVLGKWHMRRSRAAFINSIKHDFQTKKSGELNNKRGAKVVSPAQSIPQPINGDATSFTSMADSDKRGGTPSRLSRSNSIVAQGGHIRTHRLDQVLSARNVQYESDEEEKAVYKESVRAAKLVLHEKRHDEERKRNAKRTSLRGRYQRLVRRLSGARAFEPSRPRIEDAPRLEPQGQHQNRDRATLGVVNDGDTSRMRVSRTSSNSSLTGSSNQEPLWARVLAKNNKNSVSAASAISGGLARSFSTRMRSDSNATRVGGGAHNVISTHDMSVAKLTSSLLKSWSSSDLIQGVDDVPSEAPPSTQTVTAPQSPVQVTKRVALAKIDTSVNAIKVSGSVVSDWSKPAATRVTRRRRMTFPSHEQPDWQLERTFQGVL